jgi:hypothetical protein
MQAVTLLLPTPLQKPKVFTAMSQVQMRKIWIMGKQAMIVNNWVIDLGMADWKKDGIINNQHKYINYLIVPPTMV